MSDARLDGAITSNAGSAVDEASESKLGGQLLNDIGNEAVVKSSAKKKRTANRSVSLEALETRLRQEAGDFDFKTLISGVSTISQPGIARTSKPEDCRLPTPVSGPQETPTDVPVPGIPGLYTRNQDLSGRVQAPATVASVSTAPLATGSGPLDSARAYSEYAQIHSPSKSGRVSQTAGWTYRTRRSYDFGTIVGIVVIAAVLCVGIALIASMMTKPGARTQTTSISSKVRSRDNAAPKSQSRVNRGNSGYGGAN